MRTSIERLRASLAIGAVLLLLVIAGFLGYAHFRAHRFLKDLPGRLGADLRQETNGYTYSQTLKGKTVFTIHAAKALQRKDGKTTLRDVGIVLYGQQGDRADRIYGSEFEYDQTQGVVRAMGVVHLDLQAPAPTDANARAQYAAGQEIPGAGHSESSGAAEDDRLVHVKTSGLVFLQKLGVASTREPVEFRYGAMNGTARGADYSSDTGVAVLESEVRVSGLREGRPVLLTAARAEMDRPRHELRLKAARYLAIPGGETTRRAGGTATAAEAVLQLRSDGSVEHAVGEGGVTLAEGERKLSAPAAELITNAKGEPRTVHLRGGLVFSTEGAGDQSHGTAAEGTAQFGGGGQVETAQLRGGVELYQRTLAGTIGSASWSERTLSGDRADAIFGGEGSRRSLREVTASGGAHLLMSEPARQRSSKGALAGRMVSELSGALLRAQMQSDGTSVRLSHVSGSGGTTLKRREADGAEQTSRGDVLDASFVAAPGNAASGTSAGKTVSARIERAEQRGHVEVTDVPAAHPGQSKAVVGTTAKAEQGSFDGASGILTLTGAVEVTQGDGLLLADTVRLMQASGDASATGAVKATYRQTGGGEPVHVLAARAEVRRDADVASFFGASGSSGALARMWQGGSQIEASTIEMHQRERRLAARAEGEAQVVHTVLVSGGGQAPGEKARRARVLRVTSRTLAYTEADRRVEFGGGVTLEDGDGTVRSNAATVLLKSAAAGMETAGSNGAVPLGGSVERIQATGGVHVEQPGRRASGEQLVYTASDGEFVLTGTPAAPPTVVDEAQGTVTGATLKFHAGDNSVVVAGDAEAGERRRVRTETRVRQQ